MSGLEHRWLGRIDYADAVHEMERRRAVLLDGDDDAPVLLLCEHHAVITLGRSAVESEILISPVELAKRGVDVVRSSRGGDVTYHGPGQLMIYPVVRLRRGLLPLLEAIASEISALCAKLGVVGAQFRRSPAGVWIGDRKIAACGVHIRRRVMIHGFALNVSTPPAAWRQIVPCGLANRPIASLAELGADASVEQVVTRFGADLARAVAVGAGFELR